MNQGGWEASIKVPGVPNRQKIHKSQESSALDPENNWGTDFFQGLHLCSPTSNCWTTFFEANQPIGWGPVGLTWTFGLASEPGGGVDPARASLGGGGGQPPNIHWGLGIPVQLSLSWAVEIYFGQLPKKHKQPLFS